MRQLGGLLWQAFWRELNQLNSLSRLSKVVLVYRSINLCRNYGTMPHSMNNKHCLPSSRVLDLLVLKFNFFGNLGEVPLIEILPVGARTLIPGGKIVGEEAFDSLEGANHETPLDDAVQANHPRMQSQDQIKNRENPVLRFRHNIPFWMLVFPKSISVAETVIFL